MPSWYSGSEASRFHATTASTVADRHCIPDGGSNPPASRPTTVPARSSNSHVGGRGVLRKGRRGATGPAVRFGEGGVLRPRALPGGRRATGRRWRGAPDGGHHAALRSRDRRRAGGAAHSGIRAPGVPAVAPPACDAAPRGPSGKTSCNGCGLREYAGVKAPRRDTALRRRAASMTPAEPHPMVSARHLPDVRRRVTGVTPAERDASPPPRPAADAAPADAAGSAPARSA